MKKLLTAFFGFAVLVSMSGVAYASDVENDPVILSQERTSVSLGVYETRTVYDIGGGFTAEEVITEDFRNRSEGTATRTANTNVMHDGSTVTRISVWGIFKYDGSKATVLDCDQTHTTPISGYAMATFTKDWGNSAFLSKAYVKVDYKVTKQDGGSSIGSGKLEVTCDKNGNA